MGKAKAWLIFTGGIQKNCIFCVGVEEQGSLLQDCQSQGSRCQSSPQQFTLCPHCYLIIFNLYCISSCPLFSTSLKTFITDNCAFHRKKCRKKVSTSTKTILYLFVNVKVLTQSLKFKKKFSQENWCSLPALLYVLLAI